MLSTDEVKEFARNNCADLIGIASTDRFTQAPLGHKPSDLQLDAQSVIVMAKRIPISIVKTIPSLTYSACYRYLNDQLRILAYKIALFMEEQGFEALPIDPAIPDYARDVRIIQEKAGPRIRMLGDFSHRHAAVMAGLGELSAGSFVVVPKFGPRIRLVSVISTAPLKPDPTLNDGMRWGLICKPEACGLMCVKACPSKALAGDGTVNHLKCRSYRDPKLYNLQYFEDIARLKNRKIHVLARMHSAHTEVETCGLCLKACPIGTTM
jgi:epoxyqueuosine reductase QueG